MRHPNIPMDIRMTHIACDECGTVFMWGEVEDILADETVFAQAQPCCQTGLLACKEVWAL